MKTGMYYSNSDVRIEEIPLPQVGDGDVLVKVRASGICGSDLMEWYRIKRAPLVLGHEVTGDIVRIGKDVKNCKPGDRVFAIHHVPCDECPECLKDHHTACEVLQKVNNFNPGGFSEYLLVSGRSVQTGLMVLPEEMSYEEGTFIEPLGTILRGQRMAGTLPGDTVVIVGSGLSGLLHIKAAKAMGAGNIIAVDIEENRLAAARNFGADHTVNAKADVKQFVKDNNGGRLADRVIICAGALDAAIQALGLIGKGGTLLFFAVPKPGEEISIDFNPFWRDDISIKTSYGSSPFDHTQAMEFIRNGSIIVSDMVSHRFPLDEIQDAFNMAADGKECLKVIISLP
ncbi:MAG: alcohol dehydrogenase catalytic domain-containing protein [Deltaproteobacteria bacterium]|nr:alcohol dehydrogenase catalytic domain-containing protein [Deltaproteobacteria bacterium]